LKRFFRKNKKALTIVGVILATTLIVGILAASTNIIGKISNSNLGGFREVNEDNLINVEMYEDLEKEYDGVDVDVDKDGVITLDGKAKSDQTIELGTFTFIHPDYSPDEDPSDLSAMYVEFYLKGCLDGSASTYYLEVEDENGTQVAINLDGKITGAYSETIGAPLLDYTVFLVIKKGAEFNNVKIYPGVYTEANASFYAK